MEQREVAKWEDRDNDIVALAKHMCRIMMDMADFIKGRGKLKTTQVYRVRVLVGGKAHFLSTDINLNTITTTQLHYRQASSQLQVCTSTTQTPSNNN
jgi:hypothetical protein